MDPSQQAKFDDLLEVASYQIAVADLGFEAFMKYRGGQLDGFVNVTTELLNESREKIQSRV